MFSTTSLSATLMALAGLASAQIDPNSAFKIKVQSGGGDLVGKSLVAQSYAGARGLAFGPVGDYFRISTDGFLTLLSGPMFVPSTVYDLPAALGRGTVEGNTGVRRPVFQVPVAEPMLGWKCFIDQASTTLNCKTATGQFAGFGACNADNLFAKDHSFTAWEQFCPNDAATRGDLSLVVYRPEKTELGPAGQPPPPPPPKKTETIIEVVTAPTRTVTITHKPTKIVTVSKEAPRPQKRRFAARALVTTIFETVVPPTETVYVDDTVTKIITIN